MGKWRTTTFKQTFQCVVCGKPLSGYKPYGSIEVFSRRDLEVRIGIMAADKNRKAGYRHLSCPNLWERTLSEYDPIQPFHGGRTS